MLNTDWFKHKPKHNNSNNNNMYKGQQITTGRQSSTNDLFLGHRLSDTISLLTGISKLFYITDSKKNHILQCVNVVIKKSTVYTNPK